MTTPSTFPFEILLDGATHLGVIHAPNIADAVRIARERFPQLAKRITARVEVAE